MAQVAPYSNAMRIGQGFNSYTQEIRLENAVKVLKNKQNTPASTGDNVELLHLPPKTGDSTTSSAPPPTPLTSKAASVNNAAAPDPNATGLAAADFSNHPTAGVNAKFTNTQLVNGSDAIYNQGNTNLATVFSIPAGPAPLMSQSVTYSTRAIENVSDIMDALNISASTSIKYGTIHGNASASFVNETKVLDSQLNYVVTVKVNNESPSEGDEMEFQPIEGVSKDQFTAIYGNCFISDFLEGGEFNAIISIKVNDKSKLRQVKQAIDVQLAVGPSPVSIEAKESFDKQHAELLQDSEVTISVNWIGGGEIKKPEVPWTISSVVAVANAFPSMVARCSAKTSAVLCKYTSLKSWNKWLIDMQKVDEKWYEKDVILNYAPCTIYTADLFDALMSYKTLWKRIDYIMLDTSKWKVREAKDIASKTPYDLTLSPVSTTKTPIQRINSALDTLANPNATEAEIKAAAAAARAEKARRVDTFAIDEVMASTGWDLKENNDNRTPIPLDPVALNEARLLCREAMTLITEEAASLVHHPELSYAEYDATTGKTRMKKPNYVWPEVLKARLPTFIRNDAADDSYSTDAASTMVRTFSHGHDLFSHVIGDVANPHRKYRAFVSLSRNEASSSGTSAGATPRKLSGLSIHAYRHHTMAPSWTHFSRDSHMAIGAFGFRFSGDGSGDGKLDKDGCAQWEGHPHFDDPSHFRSLDLAGAAGAKDVEIVRIDILYVPGSGRIAGLVFYDEFSGKLTERLAWRQWGSSGKEPEGLKRVTQEPPKDGALWRFVGVMGDWDDVVWGTVLSRFSGIWRKF